MGYRHLRGGFGPFRGESRHDHPVQIQRIKHQLEVLSLGAGAYRNRSFLGSKANELCS